MSKKFALVCAAVSLGVALTGSSLPARAHSAPPGGVASFIDATPGWEHDERSSCSGNAAGVGYVGDRLLVSGAVGELRVRNTIATAVTLASGSAPGDSWIRSVKTITMPQTPGAPERKEKLYQVDLVPAGEGPDEVALSRSVMSTDDELAASPDHGLVPAGPINQFWPNGYPTVAAGLDPERAANVDGVAPGTDIRLAIYDTGLTEPKSSSDLPQVSRMMFRDGEDADPDGDGVAYSLVAGHANAIAGVIRTVTPGALIEVGRIADHGIATDTTTVQRIAQSLKAAPTSEWPHVIVLAFGSPACLREPGNPAAGYIEPVGLRHAMTAHEELADSRAGGMVIVASAGNRGESRPYYPAAFDTVIGVGALDLSKDADGSPWTATDGTGPLATFSNRGAWVDAWAPGVALPTTHLVGLKLADDPRADELDGYAFVDGTSFSAPLVAALIADEAARDGGRDVRCAWARLDAAGGVALAPNGTEQDIPGAAVVLTEWDQAPASADVEHANC